MRQIMCTAEFTVIACLRVAVMMVLQTSTAALRPGQGAMAYNTNETALIRKLFVDSPYNPLVRPVRNASDVIQINFLLQLSQIIYIDEKNQIMKSNVWLQMEWEDFQITWNPREFGNIGSISIAADNLWTPDIVLMNNANGEYEVSYMSKIVLNSNSKVQWIPPAIYQSSCKVDVSHFPYDRQECDMKFASWSFARSELQLVLLTGDAVMDDYLPSGTWDVLESPAIIEEYFESSVWKTHILYRFKIRRKRLFYVVNLIIPCMLISFVTPSVHILPAEAGEKITLTVSIVITLIVFIFLISKLLPPFLVIPMIYRYMLFTMIMNVFTVLSQVVIINRSNRTPSTHYMSPWIRSLFIDKLPKFLFMKRPSDEKNGRLKSDCINRDQIRMRPSPEASNLFPHSNCALKPRVKREEIYVTNYAFAETMGKDFMEATNAVKFIAKHIKMEDEFSDVISDWKYIALVMDRLLFCIGMTVNVFGTIGILLNADNIFDYSYTVET